MAQEVVHGREVEVHLAGVLGPEVGHLQVDHDEAAQAQVVEEEVEVEVLAAHLQVVLAADKGEAHPQLEHEVLEVRDEPALEVALVGLWAEAQEVEAVGVLHQVRSEVGLRSGQGPGEVGDGFPLPAVQAALDLEDEHVAAPAVLEGGPCVPLALSVVTELLEQGDIVIPGTLCKHLLHKCLVRVRLGEGPYVLEVARREPLHLGKLAA